MTATHMLAMTVAWIGVGVIVVMSVGVLVTGGLRERLHLSSAVATPGALLVMIGLAIDADSVVDAFKLLLTGVLLVVSGAVGSSVTARAARAASRGRQEP